MTFGSPSLARYIYDAYHGYDKISKEWKYLGSGSTRSVYLGPDGIAYKVCHDGDYDWNLIERQAAKKWRGSKKLELLDTAIPRTALHYGGMLRGERQYVIAMEYVKRAKVIECRYLIDDDEPEQFSPCTCRYWGEPRICFAMLCNRLEDLGIPDMFSENVFYGPDKLHYIIDLGCD